MITTLVEKSESNSVLRYLLRMARGGFDIGIASPTRAQSSGIITELKKLEEYNPNLVTIDRKLSLNFKNGGSITTDSIDSNSFRGRTLRIVYLFNHETVNIETLNEFRRSVMPALNCSPHSELIILNSNINVTRLYK